MVFLSLFLSLSLYLSLPLSLSPYLPFSPHISLFLSCARIFHQNFLYVQQNMLEYAAATTMQSFWRAVRARHLTEIQRAMFKIRQMQGGAVKGSPADQNDNDSVEIASPTVQYSLLPYRFRHGSGGSFCLRIASSIVSNFSIHLYDLGKDMALACSSTRDRRPGRNTNE